MKLSAHPTVPVGAAVGDAVGVGVGVLVGVAVGVPTAAVVDVLSALLLAALMIPGCPVRKSAVCDGDQVDTACTILSEVMSKESIGVDHGSICVVLSMVHTDGCAVQHCLH